jgi:hypothetical protein
MRKGHRGGERGNQILELSDAMMEWAIVLAGAAALGIALHLAIRGMGLRWSWAVSQHAPTQLAIERAARTLGGIAPRTSAARDWQIVRWVARMGAVTLAHLRARFELGRTVAYRRIAACMAAGLLERVETLRGQPALIRATRRGLRFTGVHLRVAQVRPELVGHWIASGDVALLLETEFGPGAVLSEREIRALERDEARPVASTVVGESPDGSQILHRPDLAVRSDGHWVAVEIELTPKAPERLEAIVRAWRRARWLAGARYYAWPGAVATGVERAIARTHAGERVEVRELPAPAERRLLAGGRGPR